MTWYEEDIKHLEALDAKLTYKPKTIFYGSSTIRLWKTLYDDFKDMQPLNQGFGGSTLAACVWFFDRLVGPYQPETLVLYAGDNDLGDGRNPEEVFIFFQQFVTNAHKHFGDMPCFFISLKPSINRWHLVDKFRYANQLIKAEIEKNDNNWHFINIFDHLIDEHGVPKKEYYDTDGLHLSEKGYEVWKNVIYPEVASIMKLS
jgi:lysophospholipase L1-like esterase